MACSNKYFLEIEIFDAVDMFVKAKLDRAYVML